MKFKKITALYSILVGISIIGIWLMLYFSFSIPEIASEPRRIIMHIIAEITTGITLIIGGYGLWKNTKWGDKLFFYFSGNVNLYFISELGVLCPKQRIYYGNHLWLSSSLQFNSYHPFLSKELIILFFDNLI